MSYFLKFLISPIPNSRTLYELLFSRFLTRCEDPTECGSFNSALLCSRCGSGGGGGNSTERAPRSSPMLPTHPTDPGMSDWQCTNCDHSVGEEFANGLIDKLKEELETSRCEDAQVMWRQVEQYYFFWMGAHGTFNCNFISTQVKFKDFLRENSQILHRHHFLMVSCKKSLFYLNAGNRSRGRFDDISIEDKLETIELGLDLLKITDMLEPELSKSRRKLLRKNM